MESDNKCNIKTKSAVTPSLFAKQLCQCQCCVLQSKFPLSFPLMLPVLLICSGLPYLGNVWAKRAKKDSSNNLQVIQTFLFGFFRAPTPKQTDYFPLRLEPIIIRPPFCLLCNIELIQYWQNYYWFWSSSASLSFFIGPWTLGPDL